MIFPISSPHTPSSLPRLQHLSHLPLPSRFPLHDLSLPFLSLSHLTPLFPPPLSPILSPLSITSLPSLSTLSASPLSHLPLSSHIAFLSHLYSLSSLSLLLSPLSSLLSFFPLRSLHRVCNHFL